VSGLGTHGVAVKHWFTLIATNTAIFNCERTRRAAQNDRCTPELPFPLEFGLMNGRYDLSHRGPVMLNRTVLGAVTVAWAIVPERSAVATETVLLLV
jgi:hypothetical protein